MNQFGGTKPSDGDYGFFASPPRSTTSQFGGSATDSAPPRALGSGVGVTPDPLHPYAPPTQNTRGSRPGIAAIVGGLALVLALLAGAWFGWAAYQRSKDIVIPSTLGGRPLVTDSRLSSVADEALAGVRSDNPGVKLEVGLYGTRNQLTVLLVGRGRLDIDGEWADVGVTGASTLGKNQCASVPEMGIFACLRSSRTLGVETFVVGGTMAQASAALDEAWAAQ